MKIIPLTKLKSGQKAKIIDLQTGEHFKKRLSSLGIRPHKHLVKISGFALRGPVTIKAGHSVIALGHGMAAKIMVQV
jgi:ferrous iron transport protein A